MTRCALTLVTMTLTFAGPVFSEATTELEKRPRAVVEETRQDLGNLPKGQVSDVSFSIRNEGSAPLRILEAVPTCGCTVTEFDEEIAPGATGTVRATLDTRLLNGPSSSKVTVLTNDPDKREIELTIEATIEPKLGAFPGYARWIYTQHEPEGTIVQTVGALDDEEFDILRLESPGPYIRVDFRPATEEEHEEELSGSQWHVSATLSKTAPVGPLEGDIKVYTNHPVQELMEIPVSGFVRPIAHLTPSDGHFGNLRLEEPKRSIFHLTNFATEPMEITRIETGVPGIEGKVVPLEDAPGHRFQVVLTFDPEKMPEGRFEETVLIHTDNENRPVLELPISGSLTPTRTASSEPSGSR